MPRRTPGRKRESTFPAVARHCPLEAGRAGRSVDLGWRTGKPDVPVEQLLETVLVLVGKIRVLVDYRPLKPPCALLECQFHVFERILSVVLVVKSLFLLLDNEINNNSNLLVLEVTVLEVILERILVLRQKEL